MLLNTFTDLKTKLKDISVIRDIQWFNSQYDGIIHAAPILFVEFPEKMTFNSCTKEITKIPLPIKIHVVSSVLSEADNSVPDNLIAEHEEIVMEVIDKLNNVELNFLNGKTDSLRLSSYQHFHKYKGWMITFIEFSTRVLIKA